MIWERRSMPYRPMMSVGEIERELARLRMDEGGSLGARSSVLNLVVVTDEEAAEDVSRIVSEISGRHPSRTILMISDPEEEGANLEVRLSILCGERGGGSRQVCAEQVAIHTEGPPAGHLESLAGPLLVPDLPVFLWYANGEVPASLERGIAPLADRLILDSGAAGGCDASLRAIANLLKEETAPAIVDLQWTAISPWRSLVADLFSASERAVELGEMERVEILHGGGGECRALLLAGWLSSALDWRLEEPGEREEGGRTFRFLGPSGAVVVEILAPASEGGGSLNRIRLFSGDTTFEVSLHGERTACTTVVRGDGLVGERTVHLEPPEVGALLGEEIRLTGRDGVYEAAAERAAEMLDPS